MRKPLQTYWRDEDGEPVSERLELLIVGTWCIGGALCWWGGYHLVAWLWGLAWG